MHELLVTQAFRPDRVIAKALQVVSAVLGSNFLAEAEVELDLATIVENEVIFFFYLFIILLFLRIQYLICKKIIRNFIFQIKSNTPVLMCSVPGYDASGRVDDLAAELGKSITSIAMGSAEGFSQAEKAINSASKTGRYLLSLSEIIYACFKFIYVI